MKNSLIIFSLIFTILSLNAMKRTHDKTKTIIPINSSSNHSDHISHHSLIPDIQDVIFDLWTIKTVAKKPKEATQIIRNLSRTNKEFNRIINGSKLNDDIINIFA